MAAPAPTPPRLKPSPIPDAAWLLKVLEERLATLKRRFKSAVHSPGPEFLRKLRVAARRVKIVAELASALLHDPAFSDLAAQLRALIKYLGPVRDAAMLPGLLEEWAGRHPILLTLKPARAGNGLKRVPSHLRASRRTVMALVIRARKRLKTVAKSADYARWLHEHSLRLWRRAFVRLEQARQELDPSKIKSIHQYRLRWKALRYLAEVLSEGPGLFSARELRRMQQVQTVLGAIQDSSVLLDFLMAAQKAEPRKEAKAALAAVLRAVERHQAGLVTRFLERNAEIWNFWQSPH